MILIRPDLLDGQLELCRWLVFQLLWMEISRISLWKLMLVLILYVRYYSKLWNALVLNGSFSSLYLLSFLPSTKVEFWETLTCGTCWFSMWEENDLTYLSEMAAWAWTTVKCKLIMLLLWSADFYHIKLSVILFVVK